MTRPFSSFVKPCRCSGSGMLLRIASPLRLGHYGHGVIQTKFSPLSILAKSPFRPNILADFSIIHNSTLHSYPSLMITYSASTPVNRGIKLSSSLNLRYNTCSVSLLVSRSLFSQIGSLTNEKNNFAKIQLLLASNGHTYC